MSQVSMFGQLRECEGVYTKRGAEGREEVRSLLLYETGEPEPPLGGVVQWGVRSRKLVT